MGIETLLSIRTAFFLRNSLTYLRRTIKIPKSLSIIRSMIIDTFEVIMILGAGTRINFKVINIKVLNNFNTCYLGQWGGHIFDRTL